MDVLRLLRKTVIGAAALCVVSDLRASPPVDLTVAPVEETRPKEHPLTEDDMVYTDITTPLPEPEVDYARMLLNIPGRNLPGREGKVLFVLQRGDRVKGLKFSKDKRWIAVAVLKTRRRAWVPRNAVKLPPRKKARAQPAESAP